MTFPFRADLAGHESRAIPYKDTRDCGDSELGSTDQEEFLAVDETLLPTLSGNSSLALPAKLTPAIPGYEILEQIGRGGMGVVYKARQIGLSRVVALKMILPGAESDQLHRLRFRTEAETIARLDHPNLVAVHEVGEHDGAAFLVLEYIAGGTLEALRGSIVPPRKAAELAEKLARALHVVHQRGVLHRDLKPANIFLTPEGEPKIGDFGLAKKLDDTGFTMTGMIMGTPGYMAPEQARGDKDIGPGCDIYALGVILYELLAGRRPFVGENLMAVLHLTLTQELPPPSRFNASIPADLETICCKCLQKNAADRYIDARALADDLARWLRGDPIEARPTTSLEHLWLWAKRHPALAVSTCLTSLLLLIVLTVSLVYQSYLKQALTTTQRAVEESRQAIVKLAVTQGCRCLEEDDDSTALLWFVAALTRDQNEDENEFHHRMRIGVVLRSMPTLKQMWFDRGSGLLSAFTDDERVLLGGLAGAEVFQISTGERVGSPLGRGATLTGGTLPSYHLNFALSNQGTFSLRRGSHGPTLNVPFPEAIMARFKAPSGKLIRVLPQTGQFLMTEADHIIRLKNLQGTTLREFVGHRGAIVSLDVVDDRKLVSASDDNTARVWDLDTGKPIAPPLRHASGLNLARFSLDGTRVITASDDNTARIWTLADNDPGGPAVRHNGSVQQASFSFDGSQILTSGGDGVAKLWTLPQSPELPPAEQPFARQLPEERTWSFGRLRLHSNSDHCAILCDESGTQIGEPLLHGSRIVEAIFFDQGRKLATASDDNTVRVWDTTTGELVGRPVLLRGTARRMAASADGARLFTCTDSMARVWEVSSGLPITRAWELSATATDVGFSNDGLRATAWLRNGKTLTIDLTPSDRSVEELSRIAEMLSGRTVEAKRGLMLLSSERLRELWARYRQP
jgi:serine/threonine protein kinase/WD40 repeat protein